MNKKDKQIVDSICTPVQYFGIYQTPKGRYWIDEEVSYVSLFEAQDDLHKVLGSRNSKLVYIAEIELNPTKLHQPPETIL